MLQKKLYIIKPINKLIKLQEKTKLPLDKFK